MQHSTLISYAQAERQYATDPTHCRLPDWYPRSSELVSLQVYDKPKLNDPTRRLIGQVILSETRCSENCKDHDHYSVLGGANSAYRGEMRCLLDHVRVIDQLQPARFYCRVLRAMLPTVYSVHHDDKIDLMVMQTPEAFTLEVLQFAAEYKLEKHQDRGYWTSVPIPKSCREEAAAYRSQWLHSGYGVYDTRQPDGTVSLDIFDEQ